ncbi:hypothetical protein Pmani_009874 [Petrolisthes manimaculis]|uniref:Reverse transcriptase domain-containing protein n=1 Tax=Petrolisthes manimaculis TaxID=1843537 RepID=A0AAE1UD84_9EUCA|nr:hypothetical protein Pmani_009874 [Petrolisthes manimaculis]
MSEPTLSTIPEIPTLPTTPTIPTIPALPTIPEDIAEEEVQVERDKHPEFPHLISEKNAVKWLEEIDSRTRDNWDDIGRIELATQYTLGSAHDYIKRVIKEAGTPPSWEEVKRRFKIIYPNEITEDNLRVKLGEAKRGVGETPTDFFIRLDTLGGTLAEKSPAHKDVDTRLVANKFIKCLPPAFRTYIEEDDMKPPTKVFLKAMKLVNNNPQCKLSDADVYRETKQTVNVVVEPNKIPMGARPKQGTNQICFTFPKKDGGLRLCLDFRALNTKLKDDKYPRPNIKAILQQLGQSSIFSCLDMYQGYHQIPLDEESIEKTAFTSPEGHWEFTALPFGIKTAPACFQRIVNSILIGLIGNSAFVYLDDVIIHGRSFEEHVQNLEKVLDRLRDAKSTLKFEKCEFFTSQVNYLGHVVSSEGLKPQASKVEVIKNMEAPKTIKELQSFLGMINYYRKFIKDFSKVASPLNGLMKGAVNKNNNKNPLNWTEEAQTAFAELKSKLAEEVTLSFPDFSKNFILTTDASDKCIGGVLQQRDDEGRIRPISFFSRTLNPAETRGCSTNGLRRYAKSRSICKCGTPT